MFVPEGGLTVNAPLATPWAMVGLLVAGMALIGAATWADLSSPTVAGRRAGLVLFVFGVALLAACVVLAARS